MHRFPFVGRLLLVVVIVGTAGGALWWFAGPHAKAPAPCLQYGAFSKSVSFLIAERRGFFARAGLSVCYRQVHGSVKQIDGLIAGQYDLIATALDNVAHRLVHEQLPLVTVAGGDLGSDLSLVASHAIQQVQDLRGKAIAVDAPNSGFVFALRKILAAHGLLIERDYTLQILGGSSARYEALRAGKTEQGEPVVATMLSGNLLAQSRTASHLHVLAHLSSFVQPYQGTVLATMQDEAEHHAKALYSFIEALRQAQAFASTYRTIAIADIGAELGLSSKEAQARLTEALDPLHGENPQLQISYSGVINAIKLRQEFGGFAHAVDAQTLARRLSTAVVRGTHSLGEEESSSLLAWS